ncbi:hypothetical protein BDW42DRAFT_169396 [Aspergillus taichungensis]|uniref:Uncharacterized protein n=1 Tax=Aspergillus taichungensis TaxID=482145 RepID=A0A2J5HV70_9EURO|nr:hypothetical protein BDW42DRAFT_169396 [Aspergillus taichungensis]
MSISKTQQSKETDIILNKANVALARSQRLVASWLPAPSAEEESTNVKSEEELQREEEEIFQAVPETLGVGAPLPSKAADGSWNCTELSSNDKLRRQLLGKNYKKVMAAKNSTTPTPGSNGDGNGSSASSNRLSSRATADKQGQQQESDDDDEEDGRTAAVGNRALRGRGKKRGLESSATTSGSTPTPGGDGGQDGSEGVTGSGESTQQSEPTSGRTAPSGPKGRKKATSFLDEILADRSKKRKKR